MTRFVSPLAATRPRTALLLASGAGPDAERTWDTLPIAGVPFVLRLLRSLEARGVERVVLHARRHGDRYRRLIGCGTQLGIHVLHVGGPLSQGLEGLVGSCAGVPADEPLLLQAADAVALGRGDAQRVLCLRGWDDLHALTMRVLGGGWSTSGGLPAGGVELDALGVDDLRADGSYAGRRAILEQGARLVQSCVERDVRVGAGARLERVVALPGAAVPCGATLREGVLDVGRWVPLGAAPVALPGHPARAANVRWRALRRVAGRLLHGRGAPLRAEPRDGALVLHLPTRLGAREAAQLARLTWPAGTLLVIDLADCQHAEVEGVAGLAALTERARGAARPLALVDAPARLHDLLERAGVLERTPLFPTFAAASRASWPELARLDRCAHSGGITC